MYYWCKLLFKSQGRRLGVGIFWAFFTAVSGVALLILSGWFITATALTGVAISAGVVAVLDMYLPGSGIRFFALSRTVSRYIERLYNHDTILRLIATFRLTIFKDLSQLPVQQLHATSDSEWLSRLTADLDALDSLLLRYLIPPIAASLVVLVVTLLVSFIHLKMALILGVLLLLSIGMLIRTTILCTSHAAASATRLLSDLRVDIIEHIQGAFELQAQYLMAQHELPILSKLDVLDNAQDKLNKRVALIQLALDISLGLVLALVIYMSLYAVQQQYINGPTAVLLVMLFVGVSEMLQSIPSQFASWGKTQFCAQRLAAVRVEKAPISSQKPLALQRISFILEHYPQVASSQIKPVTFTLTAQQTLLITGRSGSGKTTVATMLIGTDQIPNHKVNIVLNSDTPLHTIAATDWYRSIAYLAQANCILSGTLKYNLSIGINAQPTQQQMWAVLEMVELAPWAKRLSKGIDTWLGETGGKLSTGQARRIGLARILLRSPQLIILDEPFNGLDSQMASRIWHNITPWLSQRMVVLLMHEQANYLSNISPDNKINLDITDHDDIAI